MGQHYEYDIGIFAMEEKEKVAKNLLETMLERDGYRVKTAIVPKETRLEEMSAGFYDLAKNKCDFLLILASGNFEKNILAQQTLKVGIQKSRKAGHCKVLLVEAREKTGRQENIDVYTIYAKDCSSAEIAMKADELIRACKTSSQEKETMQVVIANKIENSKFF